MISLASCSYIQWLLSGSHFTILQVHCGSKPKLLAVDEIHFQGSSGVGQRIVLKGYFQ